MTQIPGKKWLKWKPNHRGTASGWEWDLIDADLDADEVRWRVSELNERTGAESAPEYVVVDEAPDWVVTLKGCATVRTISYYLKQIGDLSALRLECDEALAKPCPQCGDASLWPAPEVAEDTATHRAYCPSCGREVIEETFSLLMPDDVDAIVLLHKLVKHGPFKGRSRGPKLRWPVDDPEAYHKLSKLGLAGGSSYGSTVEVFITDRGKREALKHKEP